MIILHPPAEQTGDSLPQAIVIFGLGLLGGSIYRNIIDRASSLSQIRCEFNWQQESLQRKHASQILDQVVEVANRSRINSKRIIILWSAGHAGFASSNEETQKELASFQVVLDMTRQLQSKLPSRSIEFHLLSSAGGLFEGCSYVDETTTPIPCRPYGYLKLWQENLLLKQPSVISKIYRPSTV